MKAHHIVFMTIVSFVFSAVACSSSGSPAGPESAAGDPGLDCTTNCLLEEATNSIDVGNRAVNFKSVDQFNQDFYLESYYGEVILINFSADWCGPCHQEAPMLEKLSNEYKGQGVQIITVLISGSPADWAQLHNLTFPVLYDENQVIWDAYGEGSVPLNLIIDQKRVVQYKESGFDEDGIRGLIEELL